MPVLNATATLGVGLSGCGDIVTKVHAGLWAETGYALRAAYNPTRSKAEAVTAAHGGEVVGAFDDLLGRGDIDVIVISAPPAVHAEQCCAALRAGKHVLCEKPSALSLGQNAEIERVAAETGRTVAFCSSRLRHGGFTRSARAYVEQGRLGRIYRVEIAFSRPHHRPGIDWIEHAHWFTERERAGGGVVMDMGQYLLDQVLHILGWPRVETLTAHCFQGFPHDLPASRVVDVEEQASLLARLEGDIALSMDLAACANHPPVHRIAILGDRGGLQLEHHEGGRGFSFCEEAPGLRGKLVEHKPHFQATPWDSATLYRELHAHVAGDGPAPGTTPAEASELTRWCALAYASHEQDREVTRDEI